MVELTEKILGRLEAESPEIRDWARRNRKRIELVIELVIEEIRTNSSHSPKIEQEV